MIMLYTCISDIFIMSSHKSEVCDNQCVIIRGTDSIVTVTACRDSVCVISDSCKLQEIPVSDIPLSMRYTSIYVQYVAC